MTMRSDEKVLLCGDLALNRLASLLKGYGMTIIEQALSETIEGSFWGGSEAGLIADSLYVRRDTPVHSALHEACHYICMDSERRENLDTDAGGDYDEENGVCYLQILLSSEIPEMGESRMLEDMDAWGYTFRLGSAAKWFREDAEDARLWLLEHQIINEKAEVIYRA